VPNRQTFVVVAQRLRVTGLIQPSMRGRGPQRTNCVLNVEEQILNATGENPGLSTRQLAKQFNVSQWVVPRTLHEQLLYLYQFIMYKEFKD
jgi:ribosome-binding protein aMBF1 (putative translation factor)